MGYLLSSLYGRTQVADVLAHVGRREGLPALLDQDHLAHAFEPPHLRDEGLHDDDRHDREQDLVV